VSTALAGQLGARVNGEATVALPESIAAGDPACHLTVRLDASTDELAGELHRWPAVTGAPSRSAPHLELSVNLPSETASVPVVRRLAAQALRSFGVADRDVDDVQLAIAEACANVIEHAIDSDTYEVQVELAADQCAITVIDQGSGFDATAVPANPDPRSQGGRGLALMRALTDKVAFRNEPQAGTVVHMTKRLEHDETHPLWNRAPKRR
jgi:serine/threonine-protein kinase RsbW